jgi:hypothetical protein
LFGLKDLPIFFFNKYHCGLTAEAVLETLIYLHTFVNGQFCLWRKHLKRRITVTSSLNESPRKFSWEITQIRWRGRGPPAPLLASEQIFKDDVNDFSSTPARFLLGSVLCAFKELHGKKSLLIFPFPAGKLFPARESLVSDTPPGDGKSITFFYSVGDQCIKSSLQNYYGNQQLRNRVGTRWYVYP